ncbi:MAG: AEC family transporter [Eubacteriales bacterium]|nr:AEC family transporter [Eubacteriales bacterium]
MGIFGLTANQMILMFLFLAVGWVFQKKNLLPKESDATMSKLENMVFMPCLVLNTFISRCTIENLKMKAPFFIYGCIFLGVAILFAFLLTPFFVEEKNQVGIYRYSFSVANIAFMGNAVVEGVFGEEILFDYLIFTLPINIFINSVGISWLMPNKKSQPYYQKLMNPINIASVIGIILGLWNVSLPNVLSRFLGVGAACMFPVAMLLTGFVIGRFSVKELLKMRRVYWVSCYRLIILPLILFCVMRWIVTPNEIRDVVICAYSMPLGLNTIIIPAAYGGDTTLGASMALVSNLLAFVTIPVLFGFFL